MINHFTISFKLVFFLLIIYIYVFNPAITMFSIASLRLLYPLVLFWMLSNSKWLKNYLSLLKNELKLLCFTVLFCFLRSFLGGDSTYIIDSISIVFDSFFISGFLLFYYKKYNIKINLYQVLYIVAIVAAIISVATFLSPPLNEFTKTHFYLADADAAFLRFRCFGVASGLTFDYSIIIGLALCFCLVKEKKTYEFLLIPIFLFVSLINARTGIIMPLILLAFLMFVKFKFSYWFFVTILFSCLTYFTKTSIYNDNIETFMWIEQGFLEISDIIFSTDNASGSTLETLSEDHIVLPANTIEWIFGSGVNIFNSTFKRSDVGYITQLNYGGLIYMFLIFSTLLYPIVESYKKTDKNYFIFMCFVFLTILICNYKGSLYNSNGVLRIYFIIYIYNKYSYRNNLNFIAK